MTALEYFQQKLESIEKNIAHAVNRGDDVAVKNLREKRKYYVEALKALRRGAITWKQVRF